MSDIQVGDRVSWAQRTTARPYLHRLTGTIVKVWHGGLIVVHRDGDPTFSIYVRDRDELTKIVSPIEAIVDDYAFAVGLAGSLGGVELS